MSAIVASRTWKFEVCGITSIAGIARAPMDRIIEYPCAGYLTGPRFHTSKPAINFRLFPNLIDARLFRRVSFPQKPHHPKPENIQRGRNSMKYPLRYVFGISLILTMGYAPAWGQATAQISGTVTDQSGA